MLLNLLIKTLVNVQSLSMENYIGTTYNNEKRETPIIISLAATRESFDTLPISIYSLLNQTLKPDKVILWLDKDCEDLAYLPYNITKFIKNGLEIEFVKDIGKYTKTIYAMKKYHNCIIVTADEDKYYNKNWLKKLYLSYITRPDDIHTYKALEVDINNPYEKWNEIIDNKKSSYNYMFATTASILYPPNCYNQEAFREDIFLKNAPTADNIWFWVMALIHNRKIKVLKKQTNITKNLKKLKFIFKAFSKTKNSKDIELQNLLKFYRQNILKHLK